MVEARLGTSSCLDATLNMADHSKARWHLWPTSAPGPNRSSPLAAVARSTPSHGAAVPSNAAARCRDYRSVLEAPNVPRGAEPAQGPYQLDLERALPHVSESIRSRLETAAQGNPGNIANTQRGPGSNGAPFSTRVDATALTLAPAGAGAP
jgi:hypothetical protein